MADDGRSNEKGTNGKASRAATVLALPGRLAWTPKGWVQGVFRHAGYKEIKTITELL
jgi:hypothetical protein